MGWLWHDLYVWSGWSGVVDGFHALVHLIGSWL